MMTLPTDEEMATAPSAIFAEQRRDLEAAGLIKAGADVTPEQATHLHLQGRERGVPGVRSASALLEAAAYRLVSAAGRPPMERDSGLRARADKSAH
jgi:hypothetical protein